LFTYAITLAVGRSENVRISYLQVKNNSISEDGRNQAMNDEKSLRDFQSKSWLLVSIQDQLLRPEVLHQEVLISSP